MNLLKTTIKTKLIFTYLAPLSKITAKQTNKQPNHIHDNKEICKAPLSTESWIRGQSSKYDPVAAGDLHGAPGCSRSARRKPRTQRVRLLVLWVEVGWWERLCVGVCCFRLLGPGHS